MSKEIVWPYINRFIKIFLVSLIFVFIITELTFKVQNYNIDRGPKVIELVIPVGTAARVEKGENVPSIPDEMIFVLGDVLQVRNDDNVTHELGPILVPAGSVGSMPMDLAENITLSCSFNAANYLGVDVRIPTTLKTRLIALSFAAPSTAIIAFFYSLAYRPVFPDKEE
ncbi:MAG: hypothetical protein N2D54_04430 [Chloroflexota bacterium]